MNVLQSSVTFPKGFRALGKACGIKAEKKDFAIVFSEKKCVVGMVCTKNKFKAAPLIVNQGHLKQSNGIANAIFCVSGIANACTGKKGIDDAKQQAKFLAKELGLNEENVLVASTGIIGKFLPLEKIMEGVIGVKQELSSSEGAGLLAAQAIMTTDTFEKTIAVEFDAIKIGAMAKGAGMISPDMATMLCFITTDAVISQKDLQKCLKNAVGKSFNMISIDNCMSTNDNVIAIANGLSKKKADLKKFAEALDFVCIELAKKIVEDGEGSTKIFEVTVSGAKNETVAKKAVHAIITSDLVKSAIHGGDPNWGRIFGAMGSIDEPIKTEKVELYFDSVKIVENGIEAKFDLKKAEEVLQKKKFGIKVELNDGKASATGWGCDLSEDYVKINADYHT